MKNKIFILLLTVCMILPCFNGLSVTALDTLTDDSVVAPAPEALEPDNVYNKLHFYFDTEAHATIDSVEELQAATASVKSDYISVQNTVARSGEAVEENVYITVQFASGYSEDKTYLELKAARENAKTALQRDSAKSRQNAYSKSYHQALVTENMPLLSAIPYTDFNVIDYSSFVTLTVPAASLDAQVLETIAENENILHISLTDGFEVVSDVDTSATVTNASKTGWEDVLECIGAKNIVWDGTYTGQGIKIGVYEVPENGIHPFYIENKCDLQNANLSRLGDKLHFRNESVEKTYGDSYLAHATVVVSILSIIAPDAGYYFSHVPYEDLNGGYDLEGISWFIEMGCDIVNCSFGISSLGYRYDVDAVYDYQIFNNDIVVVKSAGNIKNSTNTYITSPGYAHNVITVGGVSYSRVNNGWEYDSGARYNNPNGIAKPDISSPNHMYILDVMYDYNSDGNEDVLSGTSFATPLVTASIALYYQYFYQNVASYASALMVRSVTIASATKTVDYENTCNLDDRVGAGVVNLEAMIQASFYMFSLQGGSTYRNVKLNSGDIIQIALVWLYEAMCDAELNVYGGELWDYNLFLQDPFGNTVAISTYTENSVEYIRCMTTTTGWYRIVISSNETMGAAIQFSLSIYK